MLQLLSAMAAVGLVVADPCPTTTTTVASKSLPGGQRTDIHWRSFIGMDVVVYWVNWEGEEQSAMVLPAMNKATGGSFAGHSFRVRSYEGTLITEFTMTEGNVPVTVDVHMCDDLESEVNQLYSPGRGAEFEALAADHDSPCVGPSSNWSCVRTLTEEEWLARPKEEYGFMDGEGQEIGKTMDLQYANHIARVPRVSQEGPGFLKMKMPATMKKLLDDWWTSHQQDISPHEPIPGGYTNVDKVPMNRLNLDRFPEIRNGLVKEMQQVLQWWTNMQLRHTSTYGTRIYRRGSMLIDHVDRMDTHLASAVIQVDQSVDPDGGWPLEVLLPDRSVGEVYLQPGEMVLYEGAWVRHGRPMRFKGDMFCNIFTHFAPHDWKGPGHGAMNRPLEHMYYGYQPGRCNTLADDPSKGIGCVEPPLVDRPGAYDEEL